MSQPTQRLVVLFDGTDNTPKDRTNVWRTHELLAEEDAQKVPQKKLYVQGVGTEFGEIVRGSIYGQGVSRKIREGYEWLAKEYQPGSEIYVFGFSRGAFTARSLVQFIANCGLVHPEVLESEWTVEDAFDRYEAISSQEAEVIRPIWRLRHWQEVAADRPPGWQPDADEQRLLDDSKVRVVKVRMAGLWDTVGAMGADALENRDANRAKSAAHNVRPTKAQEYGYHALAVDEHRPMFEATLWRTFVPENAPAGSADGYALNYEQRWFIGAHSDVGGGYGDDALPDHSLRWMMSKATALGLAFSHRIETAGGSWHAAIHDSYESFAGGVLTIWDDLLPGDQRNYRKLGRDSKPFTTQRGVAGRLRSINETIDESVWLRLIEDPTYRPPGLIDFLRREVAADPEALKKQFGPLIPPADVAAGVFPNVFAQRTTRIFANEYWNRTGVALRKDRRYRVRVVPGIGEPLRDASYVAKGIEGEDWESAAHQFAAALHGKRKDDAKWFALIGTIDEEHPWIIREGEEFSPSVSGELVCYFNDVQMSWFYGNNSGWVVLEVTQVA